MTRLDVSTKTTEADPSEEEVYPWGPVFSSTDGLTVKTFHDPWTQSVYLRKCLTCIFYWEVKTLRNTLPRRV